MGNERDWIWHAANARIPDMAGIRPRRFSGVLAAFSGRPAAGARDNGVSDRYGAAQPASDATDDLDLQAVGEEREHYGHFFIQNKMFLRGWASARSNPSESLRVSIVIDDVEIGSVVADRPRANLKQLLGDNIHHGFDILIPQRYYDGKSHQVAVLAVDGSAIAPSRRFVIAPETVCPEIKIVEISPSEISGLLRISSDTVVSRNLINVWLRGERLPPNAARVSISDDGDSLRSFRLTFPRLTIADLLRDDAHIAIAGSFEIGESASLRDALGISVVRGWNNALTVSSRVLLPETLALGLKLAVYFGTKTGAPALVADVDLSLGSDEVALDRAPDGDIYAAVVADGDETRWTEPECLSRRLGELVADPTFRDWNDGAPKSWTVGNAVAEAFQSYYAFSHEASRHYGLSGTLIALKCPEGRCDRMEILRQTISAEAVEQVGASVLFGLAARSTAPFQVTVELGDRSGTIASAVFGIRTDWSFLTRTAGTCESRPPAQDCFVRVLISGDIAGSDTWCEIAGVACGEQAVFCRKSIAPARESASENLIENAQLSSWPNGLDFSEAMGRFQAAAGWFVYNKRARGVPAVVLRPARPLPGQTPSAAARYAFGIAAVEVPNYCRLEIRTKRIVLEELTDYTFSFVASADSNAIASKIDTSGLGTKPSVDIQGFPFLTQVASRDLSQIDINASNFTVKQVVISSLHATATGVHINGSFNGGTVDKINGTVVVSFATVTNLIPIPGLTVSADPADGPDAIKFNSSLGGATGKIEQVNSNTIKVEVGNLTGLAGLASLIGGSAIASSYTFDIPTLPAGLVVRSISVTSQGIVATASAQNTTLSQ